MNVLEQQLDTDLKEKLNIVSLLEFYINYLTRKKYKQILIHDITFYKYVGMYLHNFTRSYFQVKNLRKIKLEAQYELKK